jgi:hypothetical protein
LFRNIVKLNRLVEGVESNSVFNRVGISVAVLRGSGETMHTTISATVERDVNGPALHLS